MRWYRFSMDKITMPIPALLNHYNRFCLCQGFKNCRYRTYTKLKISHIPAFLKCRNSLTYAHTLFQRFLKRCNRAFFIFYFFKFYSTCNEPTIHIFQYIFYSTCNEPQFIFSNIKYNITLNQQT